MSKSSRLRDTERVKVEPEESEFTESAPEETEEPLAPLPSQPSFIHFNGAADARVLTVADLKHLGADESRSRLIWNETNGFCISTVGLTSATVDAILSEPGFSAS